MSRAQDEKRKSERKHEAARRSREHWKKVYRIIDLYESGLSDSAIGAALSFHPRTVAYYRAVLKLALGAAGVGLRRRPKEQP